MIRIQVPATSANLGPGFDVLGLAIDRYNTFSFVRKDGMPEDDLVYQSYKKVFEHLGKNVVPVEMHIDANIPSARGLGSSAACIVGGIMGANEMLGQPLDKKDILKLATEMEGHPDNVAPAIYGGLVASVMEEGAVYTGKIPIRNDFVFIALVPNFQLSTAMARAVLPTNIPHPYGMHNVGRASMLLTAFITGEDSLIKLGVQDKLHQPYRGELIPGFDDILVNAYDAGALGCYLSGAGPTVMCIGKEGDKALIEEINGFINEKHPNWKMYVHKMDKIGAQVLG